MDKETQDKLDKLEKLEAGNRARSKKYLENIKAQGKRQISLILPDAIILELARRKAESISGGKPLTYGDIIEIAIKRNINIDAKIIPIENLETVKDNVNSDVKDFSHGNAGTNKVLYKIELDKILKKIKPGQWQKEADKLNKEGIKTPKGLPWTNDNLRMTCNKLKK